MDLETWILDLVSWILDLGSWILDLGSWILDLGLDRCMIADQEQVLKDLKLKNLQIKILSKHKLKYLSFNSSLFL